MQSITPDQTIILAKQRHIEELERLSICTSFIETLGFIIHQLQAERGASCLYLASRGQRFANERVEIVEKNLNLNTQFSEALQQHLGQNTLSDAKQLTLISWILLGFDQLKTLRYQVTLLKISFPDCIESFNRLIGSVIALIFEITDNANNSKISSYLLAMYNLVQGKEFAGQERAVGSFIFGSGSLQTEHQQKLTELIALQDRHFELFCQFGNMSLRAAWLSMTRSDNSVQHQQYRDALSRAKEAQRLQRKHADLWFEVCSLRLTEIWQIQCALVKEIHDALETLIALARQDLVQTRSYLQKIQDRSSAQKELDSAFFNLTIPVEHAYGFLGHEATPAYPMESIFSLLQQQSQQIAEMESALSETKKALTERKQIERAKGLLMQSQGMTEVEAYKWMRNTAMEQNRKIIDVAENILLHDKHRR